MKKLLKLLRVMSQRLTRIVKHPDSKLAQVFRREKR